MRRVFIFRDGNMMGALMGPDPQIGVSGFGLTIREALHDLADQFDRHHYRLQENAARVETLRRTEAAIGDSPGDAIRNLALVLDERKYTEHDFPDLDWKLIAEEPQIV